MPAGREEESSLPVSTGYTDKRRFAPCELTITDKGEVVWID
jgi:hypothetical protein